MGLTVPTFDDPMSQVKPEGLPSARVAVGSPADAFNDGQSAEKLQNASMGAAKAVTDFATQQRDVADQVAHIQADTQLSQAQTQIQIDVSKMKGQDAFKAPEYMEQKWRDAQSQIADNLQGQNQRMAFARTSAQRYEDLNKSTQLHVATEGQNFADQTIQSGLDQSRDAMVVNAGDDERLEQEGDTQRQLMERWAKLKGVPTTPGAEGYDVYKQKLTAEQSAGALGVIQARLQSGLDEGAQKYFDDHKEIMSAADTIHAGNVLDASKVVGEGNDIFDDVMNGDDAKKYKYSDGTLNLEAIREKVMDDTSGKMSDQRALKVLAQVKAQGAEYNRDRYHQISANERDFANEVIKGRQSGMTLQDALKAAPKWGHDAYDIAQKQAFIQATYAPPVATKAIAHEQLKEGIENGSVELSDVDRALKNGDINAEDWGGLRQLSLKTKADGTDPQAKYTDGLIKDLAQKSFGNDKDAMAQFQYVLGKKTAGQSPEQKLTTAQEELKKVPNPDAWFWGSTQKYKLDAKQLEGQETAQGAMYQDIGYKQAQAISSGLNGGGFQRSQNPAANVQAFANTLGVKYEDMKIGTPVNTAIQSLQAKGKLVTPTAVQKLLQKYPDGNWK